MAHHETSFVVAIDNGSQSTKVLVVDQHGRVHASARVALKGYVSPAPGQWEHPDDDIWDSIAQATRLALSRFTGDPTRITGVGLCTIRFCRAVMRADGSLAQPIMSWMDERVSRAYAPDVQDAAYVTTSSGYMTHRLTGTLRDTAGNYQGAWPIDTDTWAWVDDTDSAEFAVPREMLAELVMPGEILGYVTLEASVATGLAVGLPVIATSNDKAVEALGAGLRVESTALLSLGTYIAAMVPSSGHNQPSAAGWRNFASEPHRYFWESEGIRRGMWTVAWWRDVVSGLDATGPVHGVEELLNAEAEAVPAGSGGLVTVLDWLAPTDEPHRRGALLGFDGTQGRPHIYRSILEAIAFTMHEKLSALDVPLSDLIVTGGGAQSDVFMSILASVFGVTVRRPELTDAAGMGAAICAAVGTGIHSDWDSAVVAMVRAEATFDPVPETQITYAELERRYLEVSRRASSLFDGV